MGDIKRKHKKFSRPRKMFDKPRIEAENEIVKKYGLKNKKEIWKAKAEVSKIRRRAKALIGADAEKKTELFEKLNREGFDVKDISEVLALTEENLLDKRLQTFVFKKKLANTPKQARQMIVHKHIFVDGKIVNIPSFHVMKEFENKISAKSKKEKPVKVEETKIEDGK